MHPRFECLHHSDRNNSGASVICHPRGVRYTSGFPKGAVYSTSRTTTVTPKSGPGNVSGVQAAIPDLLRLVAVPLLGWAAVRDLRTRRVPNRIWWPLAGLALVLLVWDGYGLAGGFGFRLFLVRVAISVGLVVPLAFAFWYFGGFGGADAKAFMVLAILFPTYPTYELLGTGVPVIVTDLGVFSISVLTNTVLVGLAYPFVLAVRNAASGDVGLRMFVGHQVPVAELSRRHGTLLETPSGLTRRGLDLDALRMYLRWRGTDLETLRSDATLIDPRTLPEAPNDPTDGAVHADGGRDSIGESSASPDTSSRPNTSSRSDASPEPDTSTDWEWVDVHDGFDDPWGAEAFLSDIDSTAYGTTPETLRDGLDVITSQEAVWISPGIPFILPTFVGLVLALTAGDLLFWGLGVVGLV